MAISSQGSGCSCLIPREMRQFSLSMLSTIVLTSSFFLRISDGCLIFFQLKSEMCIRPSTPFSNSIKAPKSVKFLIVPETSVPTGNFPSISSHGLASICFIPSEIRFFSLSRVRTTALTSSLIETILLGCLICLLQLISDI